MSEYETEIHTGILKSYDLVSGDENDRKVTIKKSKLNEKISVFIEDKEGFTQELQIEISPVGQCLQVVAYGDPSDEPIMIAKIGHGEAFVTNNEPAQDGLDFVRVSPDGLEKVKSAEITPVKDLLYEKAAKEMFGREL